VRCGEKNGTRSRLTRGTAGIDVEGETIRPSGFDFFRARDIVGPGSDCGLQNSRFLLRPISARYRRQKVGQSRFHLLHVCFGWRGCAKEEDLS